jgi:lysophospholipase L1-like esterase
MKVKVIAVFIVLSQILSAIAQEDSDKYSFLNKNMNYIQFYQRNEIDKIAEKWKKVWEEKFVIAHFGDSHVQSDVLTGEYRKILQNKIGNGGRGMIFPYSTADTYSSAEYKSTHSGEWVFAKSFIQPPKLPLGNTGMAANTIDSTASFTLSFKNSPDSGNTLLRIYCKFSKESYDIDIWIDSTVMRVKIDDSVNNNLPFVEIEIPPLQKTIICKIIKTESSQNFFEIYGLELVNPKNYGVVVHCLGVGASRFQSILYQKLLYKQLPHLNPDLVILDFGTNDYLYKDIILKSLEGEVKKIIDSVRKWVPDAAILLTSTMDMSRKGRHRKSGVAFSELMHKIAKEKKCLMYDWFWIAGGRRVMTEWVNAELGQKDMIHLTWKGYRLKGSLLADAFQNTLDSLEKNNIQDSLVFSRDSLIALEKVVVYDLSNGFWHDIKSGESLGIIAQKYNVTVAEIMEWNDLSNTKIIAGKQLWIHRKKTIPK